MRPQSTPPTQYNNAPSSGPSTQTLLDLIIDDIKLDGVLDVQAPKQIAEDLNLSRPAEDNIVVFVQTERLKNNDDREAAKQELRDFIQVMNQDERHIVPQDDDSYTVQFAVPRNQLRAFIDFVNAATMWRAYV